VRRFILFGAVGSVRTKQPASSPSPPSAWDRSGPPALGPGASPRLRWRADPAEGKADDVVKEVALQLPPILGERLTGNRPPEIVAEHINAGRIRTATWTTSGRVG
jgi:hypothetical protein